MKTQAEKLKCVVIDDESLAIEVIENYINRVSSLSLEARFNNGIDALSYVNASPVDILFIDIQMPDINGMDFLKLLQKKVNVVFTSAYPEYALEGYDHQPLDFLVKPFSFEKFMRAVGRAESIQKESSDKADINNLYFYIKAKGKNIRLLLSDILYIQGLKDYVIFHTSETKHISLHSMKELEEKLPKNKFIRTHKSYIVAVDKIEEVKGNQVRILDQQVPIGRQYKLPFSQFLETKKL